MRALFALFLVVAFCHISWLSRYPSIRSDLGLSLSEMSLFLSALALGSAIGLLSAGPLIRAGGVFRVLVLSIPTMGLAFIAAVAVLYSPVPQLAFAILPIYGAAFSVADVAATVSGADAERVLGRSRMSLFYAAFSIGSLAALIVGAVAESIGLPTVPHLIAGAFVLLLVGGAGLRKLPRTPTGSRALRAASAGTGDRLPLRQVLTGRIIVLGAIGASASLAESAANNWVPLALIDGHGVKNGVGVLALAIVVSGSILIRLSGDRLIARIGRVAALQVTLLLGIVGVLFVILSPAVWLVFIGVALWGVGIGLAGPIAFSAAADDPALAAQRVATVSVINYAGFLVSPALFGFLSEAVGLRASFVPITLLLLLSVIFAGTTQPRKA